MFDHIGLQVANLERSARFYGAVLAPLGHEAGGRDGTSAGFGPRGAPALWLYASPEPGRGTTHLAFVAESRDAVAGFHEAGLNAGGADNGSPGLRESYAPNYYAAFLIDPDGNNIEAVCLE